LFPPDGRSSGGGPASEQAVAQRENAKVGEKAFAEPRDGVMLTALGAFIRRGSTAFPRFDEARTEE
jgi:hypothetical protein